MLQSGKFKKHISKGNRTIYFPASWMPLEKPFPLSGTCLILVFSIGTPMVTPSQGMLKIRCLRHSQSLP